MTEPKYLVKNLTEQQRLNKCATQSRYAARTPEKQREKYRRYIAKKKHVNENYTIEDERYTKELFNYKCFNCYTVHHLCVDHHNPLSKGYPLTRTNAVILCRSCNSSKGSKMPQEFYTREDIIELTQILG